MDQMKPRADEFVDANRRREQTAKKIAEWLADGKSFVAVYENVNLGHPQLGRRICCAYALKDHEELVVGKTTAPDLPGNGPGWRYVLKEKCLTAQTAMKAMGWDS